MAHLEPLADQAVRSAVNAFLLGVVAPELSGETVFETRNSRYRLLDGTLFSSPDASLVGAELVGWLIDSPRGSVVESAWQQGSRAVLVDRKRGQQIIVTSTTRMLHLEDEVHPPTERDPLPAQHGSDEIHAGSALRHAVPSPPPHSRRTSIPPCPPAPYLHAVTAPRDVSVTFRPLAREHVAATPLPEARRATPVHPPPRPIAARPSPPPARPSPLPARPLPLPSPPPRRHAAPLPAPHIPPPPALPAAVELAAPDTDVMDLDDVAIDLDDLDLLDEETPALLTAPASSPSPHAPAPRAPAPSIPLPSFDLSASLEPTDFAEVPFQLSRMAAMPPPPPSAAPFLLRRSPERRDALRQ